MLPLSVAAESHGYVAPVEPMQAAYTARSALGPHTPVSALLSVWAALGFAADCGGSTVLGS